MKLKTSRLGQRLLARLMAFLAVLAIGSSAPALADSWPASVRAIYDVNFNGFNIGSLEFRSEAEQHSYTLLTNTRLSILLGAFTFDGETRSFGLLVNQAPKPAAFTFDFRSNLRAGSTKIGFSDGSVTNVTNLPPPPANANTIPLREQHLKGVLDPLSAIMVVSRGAGNPCERRVPIFDGKERFDLIFSYKGEMKVNEQQPSGQPDVAFVCRVRYLPIAGHKADPETRYMAGNDAIEVALRPVPSANMLVPYQINIPTLAGFASIVSKRVEIATPGKAQIALTH
jgi:hypothetical protein